jgi:AcrR family transcriptional regulator
LPSLDNEKGGGIFETVGMDGNQKERKQQILAAARQVVERVGYNKASTREIAKEANVNIAMLNYYFGTKEELLNETLAYSGHLAVNVLAEETTGAETLSQFIDQALDIIWRLALEFPELHPFELLLRAPYNEEARKQSLLMYDNYKQLILNASRNAIAKSGDKLLVSEEAFANLMVSGIEGIVLNYRVTADKMRGDVNMETFKLAVKSLVVPNIRD